MKSAVPVFALILSGSLAVIATGMRKANDDTVATRNQSAEQELKALERKLNELSLHGDRSAVTKIVADDFVGMDAGYWDGKVQWVPQDKAAFANDVVSTSSHLSEVSVNDLEARVHGQTGIVRGRAVFKMKDGRVFDTHFLDNLGKTEWPLDTGRRFYFKPTDALKQSRFSEHL